MPALRAPGLSTRPRALNVATRASCARWSLTAALTSALAIGCADAGAAGGTATGGPGLAGNRDVALGVALNPERAGMAAVARGVELAVSTLNTEPATRARHVHFVVRHTPHGVTGAVAAAERLRDDPAVIGIVGDAESGRTLDALPVIDDAEHDGAHALAAITPTATSAALAGRSPWLFRLSPDDETASRAVAAYATDSLGARRAAVIYRNDSYGRDWAAAFARAFERRGGTLVVRDPYLAGVTSWPVYARYIAARHPDVLLFPGSAEDAAELLRALRAAGDRTPVIGGDAVASLVDSAQFAGLRYAVPFTADAATRPGAPAPGRAFVARYQARYGERPGVRAAMAYEGAMLLGRATLAVDPAAPDRRRRVRDWLAALGRTAPAVPGVVGPIAFDPRHGVTGRGITIATVRAAVPAAVPAATRGTRR